MNILKKRILIILLIIILSLTVIYIYSINKVKNSVNYYLTNIKGYSKNEYSLNVIYQPLNSLLPADSPYVITVVFNDEPSATYYYKYRKNGEVSPSGAYDENDRSGDPQFKH
jgi:hypothetical protein